MEVVPVWLKRFVLQDLKSVLEIDVSQVDDDDHAIEELNTLSTTNYGDISMSSQSAVYVKLNSNLYSFDGILFLIMVRIYSGHGTERERAHIEQCVRILFEIFVLTR